MGHSKGTIVVVRWYIKQGQEEKFRATWIEMDPKFKDGLFREFFSKPVNAPDEKYHTLDLESQHYSTFINIGVWKSLSDFDRAIGSMIPGRDKHPDFSKSNKELIEVFDFEFKLRERIVMDVETTRGGDWIPPSADF
jgi:hypothetical protein